MTNPRRMQMAAANSGSSGYKLFTWGASEGGCLGHGAPIYLSSPVQVGSESHWLTVDGGSYTLAAITNDYKLFTWGVAGGGMLGDAQTAANVSSPVQVGALTDWLKVSVGRNSCHAIKTDGTLWAWGGAASGQLGNGTVVNNSSPIQIGSKTNWTYVSNANNNCFAIDTDGKLYSWGFANFGITGHGNTTTLSVPTQVGGLTTWAQVSGGRYNTIARKTDGTIWAWGRGAYGTIGQSDAVDHQSPVQVGSLTTWANIFCNFRTAVGVTTSGTLFAWGDNDSGEVGVGSKAIEAHSSPVQVGSLTNWSSSRGSTKSIFALKTDKTAWAWGDNHAGTLGQGTAGATDGSSPVQIGSDTNWVRLGGNFFGSVAWGLTE